MSIIEKETNIKIQTRAISCLINFVQGLIHEDEQEIEDTKKSSDILALYADPIFNQLQVNLKQAIQTNYEPMQEEVMTLINVSATIIEEKFGKYFGQFMPLMTEILQNVDSKTPEKMQLRARTIETIGYMITAIEGDEQFRQTVQQVTETLFGIL